jgi:hypothetical protein
MFHPHLFLQTNDRRGMARPKKDWYFEPKEFIGVTNKMKEKDI